MKNPSKKYHAKTAKRDRRPGRSGRRKSRFVYLDYSIMGCPLFARFDPEDAARLTGYSLQTVYHFIAGSKPTPARFTDALRLHGVGLLPFAGWEDWRIDPQTGEMITPQGDRVSRSEVEHLQWFRGIYDDLTNDYSTLRQDHAGLRAAYDLLDEQHRAIIAELNALKSRAALAPPANVLAFRRP